MEGKRKNRIKYSPQKNCEVGGKEWRNVNSWIKCITYREYIINTGTLQMASYSRTGPNKRNECSLTSSLDLHCKNSTEKNIFKKITSCYYYFFFHYSEGNCFCSSRFLIAVRAPIDQRIFKLLRKRSESSCVNNYRGLIECKNFLLKYCCKI